MVQQPNQNSMALTRREQQSLAAQPPENLLGETMQMGQIFAASGFFNDTRDQAQAVVKIMAGRELGLQPIAAMTSINVIKGRVTLSAQAMAAVIKASGEYDFRVIDLSNSRCEIEFFKGDEPIGTSVFTMEDADAAELRGGNWKKYPRNMLYARALSNGARWHCPHIISGAYTPEELEADEKNFEPPKRQKIQHGRAEQLNQKSGWAHQKSDVHDPPAPVDVGKKRNGRPVDAGEGEGAKASFSVWAAIHSAANKSNLKHEDLHEIFKVESLKELRPDELNNIPINLDEWREQDDALEVDAQLSSLREDLECCENFAEMGQIWEKWQGEVRGWSPAGKHKAKKIKDKVKAAFSATPEESTEGGE